MIERNKYVIVPAGSIPELAHSSMTGSLGILVKDFGTRGEA
jgi:hypothetical protein